MIAYTITYCLEKKSAKETEILNASKVANAHEFIKNFPKVIKQILENWAINFLEVKSNV